MHMLTGFAERFGKMVRENVMQLYAWWMELNFRKVVALITVNCFLFSFVYGSAAAAVVDGQRSESSIEQLINASEIPHTMGRITQSRDFGTDRMVMVVQDLHCHPEVQRNISDLLGFIDKQYRLEKIYLEGSHGAVNTSWLTAVSDKDVRQNIADGLLNGGKLTGAEYFSATSGKTDIINGLENDRVYNENVQRLNRILDEKSVALRMLKDMQSDIQSLKDEYLNSRQQRLEKIIAQYRDGKLGGMKYYAMLGEFARKLDLPITEYTNIVNYLEVARLERQLDYRAVSRQMHQFVTSLKQTLPYEVYTELQSKTDNFTRMDQLCVYLAGYARSNDLGIERTMPELAGFLRYIELNRSINPEKLVYEEKKLTREILDTLSSNRSEKEAVFLIDFQRYLDDMVNNRITVEDYAYFKQHIRDFELLWVKYTDNEKYSFLSSYLSLLNDYCRVNLERNDCFEKNMSAAFAGLGRGTQQLETIPGAMPSSRTVSVVVAGGFHTEGIKDILEQQKISYAIITPNVTQDTAFSDRVYEQAMRDQVRFLSQAMAVRAFTLEPTAEKALDIAAELALLLRVKRLSWEEIAKRINPSLAEIIAADKSNSGFARIELVLSDSVGAEFAQFKLNCYGQDGALLKTYEIQYRQDADQAYMSTDGTVEASISLAVLSKNLNWFERSIGKIRALVVRLWAKRVTAAPDLTVKTNKFSVQKEERFNELKECLLGKDQFTLDELRTLSVADMVELLRSTDLSAYDLQEKFLIYSGAPGSGKGELMDRTFGKGAPLTDLVSQLLLYHTRPARNGEIDGKKYHFSSDKVGTQDNRLAKAGDRVITTFVNKQLQGVAKGAWEEEVVVRPDVESERLLPGDVIIEVNGKKIERQTVTEEAKATAETKVIRKIKGLQEAFKGSKIAILEGGYGWFSELRKHTGSENIFSIFLSPFTPKQLKLRSSNQQIIDSVYSDAFERFVAYSLMNMMRKSKKVEELDLRDSATLNELKSAVKRWLDEQPAKDESVAVKELGRNEADQIAALRANAALIESDTFVFELNRLIKEYFKKDDLSITDKNRAQAKSLAYEVQWKLARDVKRGDTSFELRVPSKEAEKEGKYSSPEDMFNRVLEGVAQIMLSEEYARDGKGAIVLNPFVYNTEELSVALQKVADDFCKAYFSYLLKAVANSNRKHFSDLLKYFDNDSTTLIDQLKVWQEEYKVVLGKEISLDQLMHEEFLLVTDENGNDTGKIRPRNLCHATGDWHKTVGIIVIDEHGQMLVQTRAENKAVSPNCYDVSAGGHAGLDAALEEGAQRELEEELFDDKIKVDPTRLVRITPEGTYIHNAGVATPTDRENATFFVYIITDKEKQDIQVQQSELSGAKFHDVKTFLAQFDRVKSNREVIEELKQDRTKNNFAVGFLFFTDYEKQSKIKGSPQYRFSEMLARGNEKSVVNAAVDIAEGTAGVTSLVDTAVSITETLILKNEIARIENEADTLVKSGILTRAVALYKKGLQQTEKAQEKGSALTDGVLDATAQRLREKVKTITDAISAQNVNAVLIESQVFIDDINELLKVFDKSALKPEDYDSARAMAYEVNKRLSSREGYLKFRRDKRPEYGIGISDPENDRYNRVLEGVIQILNRHEYTHVLVNPWGYDAATFEKNINSLSEEFAHLFFENVVKGIKGILKTKGALATAPPALRTILKELNGLSDATIASMTSDELVNRYVRPLIEMKGGLSIFHDMQEKFLLYSAGPGTGKGELMDRIFTPELGKYADLIDKLMLYHTRSPRVKKGESEKDGIAYHFRTDEQLRVLEKEGRVVTALVNRQLQGLAEATFEEDILIPKADLANNKKGVVLDGDKVVNEAPEAIVVRRTVRGSQAIFDGEKPVILEGGYGWFRALKEKYPRIAEAFISPFSDSEIEIRASNTQWINETFRNSQERRIAYEELAYIIMREKGEVDVASNEKYQKEIVATVFSGSESVAKINELKMYFGGSEEKLFAQLKKWQDGYKVLLGDDISVQQLLNKEYLLLLDENGEYKMDVDGNRLIGPRDLCKVDGSGFKTVFVVLIDKDGKMLVQTRSKDKKLYKHCRDTSASGHQALLTDPKAAAINETQEEVFNSKIKVDPKRMVEINSFRQDFKDKGLNNWESSTIFAYYVNEDEKNYIEPQPEEVEKLEWVDFDAEYAQFVDWRTNPEGSKKYGIDYASLGISILAREGLVNSIRKAISKRKTGGYIRNVLAKIYQFFAGDRNAVPSKQLDDTARERMVGRKVNHISDPIVQFAKKYFVSHKAYSDVFDGTKPGYDALNLVSTLVDFGFNDAQRREAVKAFMRIASVLDDEQARAEINAMNLSDTRIGKAALEMWLLIRVQNDDITIAEKAISFFEAAMYEYDLSIDQPEYAQSRILSWKMTDEPLNAGNNAEKAKSFLRGGYQQEGYGVAEGAAINGSLAFTGNQGYFTKEEGVEKGKNIFVDCVKRMREYIVKRNAELERNYVKSLSVPGRIWYVIQTFFEYTYGVMVILKLGIGGQHTPFQGIAEGFRALKGREFRRSLINGEYEMGKDYEAALNDLRKEMGLAWDQIVIDPSSKSGATDETMMIFSEILYIKLKYTAQGLGFDGEKFAGLIFDTLHDVNFMNGKERAGKDLFKVEKERFGTDNLIELITQRAQKAGIKANMAQVKDVFVGVLGNMIFETTNRVDQSRLSAFINNSGLAKELGDDAGPFIEMFDNVGGRWTADLHMMAFLAYYNIDPGAYWEVRNQGITEVKDGTHESVAIANKILDENITDIAMVVPDWLFWFGKSIEQNFNESIWQDGFANLITIKQSQWDAQKANYQGKQGRMVINLSSLKMGEGFNTVNVKVADVKSMSKLQLVKTFGSLTTTFYGITSTVGNRLIVRALKKAGYSAKDVDINDLTNPATKIFQDLLYLRQPFVELGKGLVEKRLKMLQEEEAANPGAIDKALADIKAKAATGAIETNISEFQIPANISDMKTLAGVIKQAIDYAKANNRKFVPFIYLEGDKFYELRNYLTELGIEWVLQGTGDQHISYQQVLRQPQKYLPFIISFVPEKTQPGRRAIGFAKGYLDNISPNMGRDYFAEASYQALTVLRQEAGGRGFFLRLTDTEPNRAMLRNAVTSAVKVVTPGTPSTPAASTEVGSARKVVADDGTVYEIPKKFRGVEFGTSGHRGKRGEQVNTGVAASIAQGVCEYINNNEEFIGKEKILVVGGDPRPNNKDYQEEETRIALANGFTVWGFAEPMPTPICSYVIRFGGKIFHISMADNKVIVGGINNTPSHNPYEDDGIKFNPGGTSQGAPSSANINKPVQERANEIIDSGRGIKRYSGELSANSNYKVIDREKVAEHYISRVSKMVDFNLIRKAIREKGMKWTFNVQNGASGWWSRKIIGAIDENFCDIVNEEAKSDFGGLKKGPNTEKWEQLAGFIATVGDRMKNLGKYIGGGATDGDGDRFFFCDEKGNEINFGVVLALLFNYLVHERKIDGAFKTCVDASGIFEKIGKVATRTEIGFKAFQDDLKDPSKHVVLAGECGSGGLTFGPELDPEGIGHILDKDGTAAQLLFMEMAAAALLQGKTISDLVSELNEKYGNFSMAKTASIALPVEGDEGKEMYRNIVGDIEEMATGGELFGYTVATVDKTDGLKVFLNDQSTGKTYWILIRLSGTGGGIRAYGEAVSDNMSLADEKRDALMSSRDTLIDQLIKKYSHSSEAANIVEKIVDTVHETVTASQNAAELENTSEADFVSAATEGTNKSEILAPVKNKAGSKLIKILKKILLFPFMVFGMTGVISDNGDFISSKNMDTERSSFLTEKVRRFIYPAISASTIETLSSVNINDGGLMINMDDSLLYGNKQLEEIAQQMGCEKNTAGDLVYAAVNTQELENICNLIGCTEKEFAESPVSMLDRYQIRKAVSSLVDLLSVAQVALVSGKDSGDISTHRVISMIRESLSSRENVALLKNFTVYANGGVTKITYDGNNEVIHHLPSTMGIDAEMLGSVERTLNDIVQNGDLFRFYKKAVERKLRHSTSDEVVSEALKKAFAAEQKIRGVSFRTEWVYGGHGARVETLLSTEVREKNAVRSCPWIEVRKNDEQIAQIAIKYLPSVLSVQIGKETIVIDLDNSVRLSIAERLKQYTPIPSGKGSLDVGSGKEVAVDDFIAAKNGSQRSNIVYLGYDFGVNGVNASILEVPGISIISVGGITSVHSMAASRFMIAGDAPAYTWSILETFANTASVAAPEQGKKVPVLLKVIVALAVGILTLLFTTDVVAAQGVQNVASSPVTWTLSPAAIVAAAAIGITGVVFGVRHFIHKNAAKAGDKDIAEIARNNKGSIAIRLVVAITLGILAVLLFPIKVFAQSAPPASVTWTLSPAATIAGVAIGIVAIILGARFVMSKVASVKWYSKRLARFNSYKNEKEARAVLDTINRLAATKSREAIPALLNSPVKNIQDVMLIRKALMNCGASINELLELYKKHLGLSPFIIEFIGETKSRKAIPELMKSSIQNNEDLSFVNDALISCGATEGELIEFYENNVKFDLARKLLGETKNRKAIPALMKSWIESNDEGLTDKNDVVRTNPVSDKVKSDIGSRFISPLKHEVEMKERIHAAIMALYGKNEQAVENAISILSLEDLYAIAEVCFSRENEYVLEALRTLLKNPKGKDLMLKALSKVGWFTHYNRYLAWSLAALKEPEARAILETVKGDLSGSYNNSVNDVLSNIKGALKAMDGAIKSDSIAYFVKQEADYNSFDGFIWQGVKAAKKFFKNLKHIRKTDVTDQYRVRILQLITNSQVQLNENTVMSRDEKHALHETFRTILSQFDGSNARVYGFNSKSFVESSEDYFFDWNNLVKGELFLPIDQLAQMPPALADELLMHILLCPILGHSGAIQVQQMLFPQNYHDKTKLALQGTKEFPEQYKGLLGEYLRKFIDENAAAQQRSIWGRVIDAFAAVAAKAAFTNPVVKMAPRLEGKDFVGIVNEYNQSQMDSCRKLAEEGARVVIFGPAMNHYDRAVRVIEGNRIVKAEAETQKIGRGQITYVSLFDRSLNSPLSSPSDRQRTTLGVIEELAGSPQARQRILGDGYTAFDPVIFTDMPQAYPDAVDDVHSQNAVLQKAPFLSLTELMNKDVPTMLRVLEAAVIKRDAERQMVAKNIGTKVAVSDFRANKVVRASFTTMAAKMSSFEGYPVLLMRLFKKGTLAIDENTVAVDLVEAKDYYGKVVASIDDILSATRSGRFNKELQRFKDENNWWLQKYTNDEKEIVLQMVLYRQAAQLVSAYKESKKFLPELVVNEVNEITLKQIGQTVKFFGGIRLNLENAANLTEADLAQIRDVVDVADPEAMTTVVAAPRFKTAVTVLGFKYMTRVQLVKGQKPVIQEPRENEWIELYVAEGDVFSISTNEEALLRGLFQDVFEAARGAECVIFPNIFGLLRGRVAESADYFIDQAGDSVVLQETEMQRYFNNLARTVAVELNLASAAYPAGIEIGSQIKLDLMSKAGSERFRKTIEYESMYTAMKGISGSGIHAYLGAYDVLQSLPVEQRTEFLNRDYLNNVVAFLQNMSMDDTRHSTLWRAAHDYVADIRGKLLAEKNLARQVEYVTQARNFLRGMQASILENALVGYQTVENGRDIYRNLMLLSDSFAVENKKTLEIYGLVKPEQHPVMQFLASDSKTRYSEESIQLCKKLFDILNKGSKNLTKADTDSFVGLQSSVQKIATRPLVMNVLYAKAIIEVRRAEGKPLSVIQGEVEPVINPILARIGRDGTLKDLLTRNAGKDLHNAWAVNGLLDIFELFNRMPKFEVNMKKMRDGLKNMIFGTKGIKGAA